MKYDDLILDCSGDCKNCEVTLECQYQTAVGAEKQRLLDELNKRDNSLEQTTCNDTTCEEVPTEEVSGEEVPTEEVSGEEMPTEEVSGEEVFELAETCEDCCECQVIVPTKEQVDGVFCEVFNLPTCTDECEEAQVTTPTSEQVEQAFNEVFNLPTACEQVESEALDEQVVDECEMAQVTTPTSEQVEQVFNEVFNLPTACEQVESEALDEQGIDEPVEVIEQASESPAEPTNEPAIEQVAEQVVETATEPTTEPTTEQVTETVEAPASEVQSETPAEVDKKAEKETFKLVPPPNNQELMDSMCAKRARKLLYRPTETLISATFTVLGTDKKNEIGEKVKDVIDAEIKQGVKVGYLDKFDGLTSSEIKEEYEDDICYEYADQEFKKTGVIYDGKKIKVYIYDWDGKACHHIGYIDTELAKDFIPYFENKEEYSFDVCGIITGGKGKRVVKVGNTLKIVKEKGVPIGVDVDIAIIKRKD